MILNIEILYLILIFCVFYQGYTHLFAILGDTLYHGRIEAQLIDESSNPNCFYAGMPKGNILGFGYLS